MLRLPVITIIFITLAGCDRTAKSQSPDRIVTPAESTNETEGKPATGNSLPENQQAEQVAGPQVGSISGRLTYRVDVGRPWRYGRYYINRQSGELADAIVCLASRSLRKYDADKEQPQTWSMDQKNFEFQPELLSIRAGDSVQFLNSDKAGHNVNASGAYDSFNVMTPVGGSLERTFARAGNETRPIDIRCDLHSQMRAWIYVFSHPFHQVTDTTGSFEFSDVPDGDYDLVAIHPAGRLRLKQPIRIIGGNEATVEVSLSPDDLIGSSTSN
ncbi:MAG: hypothetical protein GY903_20125 [Fuerstiella sp.]|nr:hypothetical protein [Fuerstiella sp.]MCP4856797.1 hypothetical protein [Fuerstiella sp.]